MKVLVSGSHGLIGGALTDQLSAEGHEVVPLLRAAPADGGAVPPGGVGWHPESETLDERALAANGPYDAVVHLAGAGIGDRRWSRSRRQLLWASRVGPTRALAEALSRLDPTPPVLVSASAVGYYGDRGDEVLEESSPPGRGFLAELCQAWEAATAPAHARCRVVQLRTAIVLAPHGGALGPQRRLFALGLGGRLGSGRQYVSWITLDDELAVIRRAIDDERLSGPVNATAPEPVTNATFTRALAAALHRPAVLPAPRSALRLAFGPLMANELLLAGQRVAPARLVGVGHHFAAANLEVALAAVLSR